MGVGVGGVGQRAASCLRLAASRLRNMIDVRRSKSFRDDRRNRWMPLPDVYAVIAYYLRHRSEVEAYLARREQRAEEVRVRDSNQRGDLSEIRARLLPEREGRG